MRINAQKPAQAQRIIIRATRAIPVRIDQGNQDIESNRCRPLLSRTYDALITNLSRTNFVDFALKIAVFSHLLHYIIYKYIIYLKTPFSNAERAADSIRLEKKKGNRHEVRRGGLHAIVRVYERLIP